MPPREKRSASSKRASAKSDDATQRQATASNRPTAHGVWSGSITFGLVTIPVELYSATRRAGVALRMLGPDGTPLARQYVCSADDRVLSRDEIARGYEVEEGKFVVVTDEELAELAPRRSRDIELARFVPRDSIDPVYFVRPYFVLPGAEQTKAYRLLAATMEASGRAALANFVMRGKAYAVALFADRGVLRAETLRFGDELRSPVEMGIGVPASVDAARVASMKRAIAKRAQNQLDEGELLDQESSRVLKLARAKLARGSDVVKAPEAPERQQAAAEADAGGEVVDLFTLIQKRLRVRTPAKVPSRAKPAVARVRTAKASPAASKRGRN